MTLEVAAIFMGLAIGLVALLVFRPPLARSVGGATLAFAALFLMPLAVTRAGFAVHMATSKQTEYCLSCHVMEPYGESLLLDDDRHLPAGHFQNRRVDREEACFSCHTQYARFGDLRAKMSGLRHLLVYVSGRTPDRISLYNPYQNRECLHCHLGSRNFEELHGYEKEMLVANEESCMSCHGRSHDVHDLDSLPKWRQSISELLEVGR